MRNSALKTSTVALLAVFATGGRLAAADEQPVSSDEMARITIDTDTVKPKGAFVRAGFWAYTADERIPVVAMIEGCRNGAGRISYNVLDPDKPEAPTKVAEWDGNGRTMLDRMADAACQRARGG